ncbi:MAG: hypothetical protein HUJ74_01080, partial [Lachnospiraceae bacterium]|nr:hypothetical protein [Lachnospiraceae bacterium]
DKVGVARRTISSWELGQAPIQEYYKHRLSVALRCPISYLFGKDEVTLKEHRILEKDHAILETIELNRNFEALCPEYRATLIYLSKALIECQETPTDDYEEEYEEANEIYN